MHRFIADRAFRLRELYKKWDIRSAKLLRLKARAGGLQTRSDLPPPLLRRLAKWIEQIALVEEKERDIISEITHIEEKHLALRKAHKLRRAEPLDTLIPAPQRDKKRGDWLWLLLLLWMMRGKGKNSVLTLR